MRGPVPAALAVLAASLAAPAAAEDAPRCASFLPAPVLEKAAGKGFALADSVARGPGESECSWMARGGGLKIISITEFGREAIRRGLSPDASPAQLFDQNVKGTEEAGQGRREALAGIGVRAAIVPSGERLVTYIELADGMVTVSAMGLSRAQAVEVARAVAKAAAAPATAGTAAGSVPSAQRLEGAAILEHDIGRVAVDYARALRSGQPVDAFTGAAAKAKRAALPEGERRESDAFVKRLVPADLAAAIRAGGVLLIEGSKATLNVVRTETTKGGGGTVTATSTTVAIPFEKDGEAWKVAQ